MKSIGLYILQVCTDCLVMFAHPNGKVVPLANTTPMTSNINKQHQQPSITTMPASHCLQGELELLTAAYNDDNGRRQQDHMNRHTPGPDDASRPLGSGMFFFSIYSTKLTLSFSFFRFFPIIAVLSNYWPPMDASLIQHHHPACEPLPTEGDGGADRQQQWRTLPVPTGMAITNNTNPCQSDYSHSQQQQQWCGAATMSLPANTNVTWHRCHITILLLTSHHHHTMRLNDTDDGQLWLSQMVTMTMAGGDSRWWQQWVQWGWVAATTNNEAWQWWAFFLFFLFLC